MYREQIAPHADALLAIGQAADDENAQQAEEWAALQAQYAAALARIDELEGDPEPPPPPPGPHMAVGSSLWTASGESKLEAYDRRCQFFDADLEIVRFFYDNGPVGTWPKFGNSRVLVSIKPPSHDVAGFIAGRYDAQFNLWFDTFPRDGVPKRVSMFHEREDDIEDGRFTHAQARAMDDHFRDLVLAARTRNPKSNIRLGLVLMGWTVDPNSGRDITRYLPTGWKYDWMGWDSYPGDNPSLDLPTLSGTKLKYGRCRDATKAHNPNANWFICETGTRNHNADAPAVYDDKQAQWINGAADIARDLGCKGWMYFDSIIGGDFRIKGPKAAAAMGDQIRK